MPPEGHGHSEGWKAKRADGKARRMHMMAMILALAGAGHNPESHDLDIFIHGALHVRTYRRAEADLNGDGRPEIFVYATDPDHCGSGGCDLFILSPRGNGYRVVMRSSVTQLPIRLLATSSRGWRDVGVTVFGGGIRKSYMARLSFDGRRYPGNPTVAPAIPLNRPAGRILIGDSVADAPAEKRKGPGIPAMPRP